MTPSPSPSSFIRPPSVKVHHLELFYYVARHGGVTSGMKHMPYGIQQPALSSQLKQLEEQIGTPLFERRPFRLTAAGQILYEYCQPFFEELPSVIEKVRGQQPHSIRLAASRAVLRSHLLPVIQSLDDEFPGCQLTMWEGLRSQIDPWFASHRIDVAITALEGKLPAECVAKPLLKLPLVLLVPEKHPATTAQAIWRTQPLPRLIGPIPEDAVSTCFERGLRERGIHWPFRIRVTSLELVETYVADGRGVGLAVQVPGKTFLPGVRALPLKGFPLLEIGVIWREGAGPAVRSLVRHVEAQARCLG